MLEGLLEQHILQNLQSGLFSLRIIGAQQLNGAASMRRKRCENCYVHAGLLVPPVRDIIVMLQHAPG